jgi:hypothetical protein
MTRTHASKKMIFQLVKPFILTKLEDCESMLFSFALDGIMLLMIGMGQRETSKLAKKKIWHLDHS